MDTEMSKTEVFGVLPALISPIEGKVLLVPVPKPSKTAAHHLAEVLLIVALVILVVACAKLLPIWSSLSF
jgi:hypothetical protein